MKIVGLFKPHLKLTIFGMIPNYYITPLPHYVLFSFERHYTEHSYFHSSTSQHICPACRLYNLSFSHITKRGNNVKGIYVYVCFRPMHHHMHNCKKTSRQCKRQRSDWDLVAREMVVLVDKASQNCYLRI